MPSSVLWTVWIPEYCVGYSKYRELQISWAGSVVCVRVRVCVCVRVCEIDCEVVIVCVCVVVCVL